MLNMCYIDNELLFLQGYLNKMYTVYRVIFIPCYFCPSSQSLAEWNIWYYSYLPLQKSEFAVLGLYLFTELRDLTFDPSFLGLQTLRLLVVLIDGGILLLQLLTELIKLAKWHKYNILNLKKIRETRDKYKTPGHKKHSVLWLNIL